MNTIKLIKHSEASSEVLVEIAKIKSVRWQYPFNMQLQWMEQNLRSNDIHLLVYLNDVLIAYTNLVNIEVIINNTSTSFMGIGNVCTLESNKGYGKVLMNAINSSINKNNWNGILFCKTDLVVYYSKFKWNALSDEIIKSDFFKNIIVMIYNFNDTVFSLKYFDRNF